MSIQNTTFKKLNHSKCAWVLSYKCRLMPGQPSQNITASNLPKPFLTPQTAHFPFSVPAIDQALLLHHGRSTLLPYPK